ncbi:uncharacterized protein LOC124897650 [Capsicum annuum]|uniref:uncharacterized protein LOC124897650 n=1 Tax=Capsicum annuum TaxID=4072 RepID=UPI001FB0529D|nr:uncharacterized protein LOC124897650 [Capsicum annuum]
MPSFHNAYYEAAEYILLCIKHNKPNLKTAIAVWWNPPWGGSYKLNTNGVCIGNPGRERRTRGVIGNANVDWVLGFCNTFSLATNNQLKLLALNEGLKLIEYNNFLPAEVNVDSMKAINMLKNGNLHYNAILDECRSRLRRLEAPVVQHCYREQNQVVNAHF